MEDKRKNNGGPRTGSGRPPVADNEKKVTVSFYIKSKHLAIARAKIQPIVDKINSK